MLLYDDLFLLQLVVFLFDFNESFRVDFKNDESINMTERISTYQRFKMMNPIIQFFKFIYLSIKIMLVVAGGHGGTRENVKL